MNLPARRKRQRLRDPPHTSPSHFHAAASPIPISAGRTDTQPRNCIGPGECEPRHIGRSVWRIPQSLRSTADRQVGRGRSIGMTSCAPHLPERDRILPSPHAQHAGRGRGRGPPEACAGACRNAPSPVSDPRSATPVSNHIHPNPEETPNQSPHEVYPPATSYLEPCGWRFPPRTRTFGVPTLAKTSAPRGGSTGPWRSSPPRSATA